MAFNKIFMKRGFLNYLIFSGILFTNIIDPNKSIALTQENIDIPKVVSYRSASCGCCKKWINHLRDNGRSRGLGDVYKRQVLVDMQKLHWELLVLSKIF